LLSRVEEPTENQQGSFVSYLHPYNPDRNFSWTKGKHRNRYWTGTEKFAFISVVQQWVVLQLYPSAAQLPPPSQKNSMFSKAKSVTVGETWRTHKDNISIFMVRWRFPLQIPISQFRTSDYQFLYFLIPCPIPLPFPVFHHPILPCFTPLPLWIYQFEHQFVHIVLQFFEQIYVTITPCASFWNLSPTS